MSLISRVGRLSCRRLQNISRLLNPTKSKGPSEFGFPALYSTVNDNSSIPSSSEPVSQEQTQDPSILKPVSDNFASSQVNPAAQNQKHSSYNPNSSFLPLTIKDVLKTAALDSSVSLKGWVKFIRKQKNMTFVSISDGSTTESVQLLFDSFNKHLIAPQVSRGASVSVSGKLQKNYRDSTKFDVYPSSFDLIDDCPPDYPFQKKAMDPSYIRNFTHLRPKLDNFKSVLRVRNQASMEIHKFYQDNDFFQIHTPIITSNDCEGGSSTFSISAEMSGDQDAPYFSKNVSLSVSGQLHLEAACLGLSKVYNFNPAFRAESSMTHRHLCEFWMVEAEVCFVDSIHLLMDLIEHSIRQPITQVLNKCPEDIYNLEKASESPFSPSTWSLADYTKSQPFARVSYTDAISILEQHHNKTGSFKYKPSWGLSLQKEHELFLADNYFQSPVFVYDYPAKIKSFYMKSNKDSKDTVACVDLIVPGIAELVGGSVREDDYNTLSEKVEQLYATSCMPESKTPGKLATGSDKYWYLDTRKYGSAPHSGYGMGFERFLQILMLKKNIRDVTMFPRYYGYCDS
ncbi:hypothetical protein BB560_004314 [Smittium megazygosporum]|uniref:asparagine--tRNA ligase n=1 Tax=Smittium megazygosporum TaxID=133381 RepID=A0A2T9Z9P7_9FUNG|nr:hypothetical protein BB560_004314 [Smittium megazygosporum]